MSSLSNNNNSGDRWLALALPIFLMYLLVGTLPEETVSLPNWLPWFLLSIVNLLLAILFKITRHQ